MDHGFSPQRWGQSKRRGWVVPAVIVAFVGVVAAVALVGKGVGPDGIRIISTGSGPKRTLRFDVKTGQQQAMTMRLRMRMAARADGRTIPSQSVSESIGMEATIMHVSPNGDITANITVTDAGVLAEELNGFSGSMTMSNRGVVKRVNFAPDGGTDPTAQQFLQQFEQSMKHAAPPFPEQPVGVGAKWEHHSSLEVMGISVEQVATMEVLAIKGDRIKLRVSVEQEADGDDVEFPGLPPGAEISLDRLQSRGTGEMLVDLKSLVPVKSSMKMTITMEMAAKFQGKEHSMEATMNMDMDVSQD